MTDPVFGLKFLRVDSQPQPVLGAIMDVVGVIGPCDTASASRFPVNTPVLVYSNDDTLADDLGADGYLLDALDAINDQLADYQVAAQCVVVRTEYGTNVDAGLKLEQTLAKIMGNSVTGTGVHAFKKAPNSLYCTPRLICAPGYTGQLANSLDTLEIGTDGVGYIPGASYQVAFQQGAGETHGSTLVLPVAHAVANSDGTITDASLVIDSYGCFMTDEPTATLPAPDGPEVTALNAEGSMEFSAQPGIGSTITLNGSVVTFVSGTPTGMQVQLGANLDATLTSLEAELNNEAAGHPGNDTEVKKCTYTKVMGTITIVHDTAGAAGNAFTLDGTVSGLSLSGDTLAGGRDAEADVQATITATIASGANPVCAELTGVLNYLIGHAYVESSGTSEVGDKNWRSTMNSKRLVPLSGGVKIMDSESGEIVVRPIAPRAIGAQIARDYATGGPFHSIANTALQGIIGPSRTIEFSLTDGACEGQSLLGANIGVLVRGNVGVETAISSGGFILISTDNAGDDSLWQFVNVCRGRDYLELSLMPVLRTYLGRSNIDRQTVMNVLTTIRSFIDRLWAFNQILGGRVNFEGSYNTAEEIRLGRITVGFEAEEPPVLRRITTMSARYRPAIDALVQELEASFANTIAP